MQKFWLEEKASNFLNGEMNKCDIDRGIIIETEVRWASVKIRFCLL